MKNKEILALAARVEKDTEGRVATMVLQSLRFCRDTSPAEWDALMASESGPAMLALWDYLRSMEPILSIVASG